MSPPRRRPGASSHNVRRRMQATPPKNTPLEMSVRSALHRRGFRFRIHRRLIPGSTREVDIVLPRYRLAILVDGCFWHGCPIHGTQAKANAEFWEHKIKQNQERDTNTTEQLQAAGWRVIRVWEHEDPETIAQGIYDIVVKRKMR